MNAPNAVRSRCREGFILAALLLSETALAQLTTDQVPRGRTVPAREQVQQDMEKSTLRLGPARLLPTVLLSNAGYDNNVFGTSTNPVGDWTATVSAGSRLLLPIGAKMYLTGDAMPSYTWYDKLASRRFFGGLYGAGLLGFFNRMSVEVDGYGSKGLTLLNSQNETEVVQTARDGSARLEVELSRLFSFFAGAEARRLRFDIAGSQPVGLLDVAVYDRTDGAARGGVRYRISPVWDLSAAVEETRTEFVETSGQRDNRSTAYLLGIHYDRPKFFVNLYGGYRQARAYNGSTFPSFSTGTGSCFISYFWTRTVELQVYGRRGLTYGNFVENPYYLQTRYGGGLNVQVLPRLLLRGYGEFGPDDYPVATAIAGGEVRRRDQGTTVGGGFSLLVFRKAVLTALASRNTYSSNIPGVGRSVFRLATGVNFQGELSR